MMNTGRVSQHPFADHTREATIKKDDAMSAASDGPAATLCRRRRGTTMVVSSAFVRVRQYDR